MVASLSFSSLFHFDLMTEGGAHWRRVAVHLLPPLPPLLPAEPIPTRWFLDSRGPLDALREHLERVHEVRVARLLHLASHGEHSLWWPFTQHQLVEQEDVAVIDSRAGSRFSVLAVRQGGMGWAGVRREGCGSVPEVQGSRGTRHEASWDGGAGWGWGWGWANPSVGAAVRCVCQLVDPGTRPGIAGRQAHLVGYERSAREVTAVVRWHRWSWQGRWRTQRGGMGTSCSPKPSMSRL